MDKENLINDLTLEMRSLRRRLREAVQAIEGGQEAGNGRNRTYQQWFGQAFLDYLKDDAIKQEDRK